MTLNETENTEFIVAHLATPLGLAYSQAVAEHDFDAALKSILTYIKYGGMPHNLVLKPDYDELTRLLEFYSRSPGDKNGSANFDYCVSAIVRCIYSILLGAQNGEVTSELLYYYSEAKNTIRKNDVQLSLNL